MATGLALYAGVGALHGSLRAGRWDALARTIMKNINKFQHIIQAYKRANHFCPNAVLPFSSTVSALANNYARSYYATPMHSVEAIEALDDFAQALNRAADSQKVRSDENLIDAFASFKSLLWFDPLKLAT